MANRSTRRGSGPSGSGQTGPVQAIAEPEVRRWPHPIPQSCAPAAEDAAMHYIRCALSYQNELLSEIKTLLEKLAADREEAPAPLDKPDQPG